MKQELVQKLHKHFDDYTQRSDDGVEFWYARDLQVLLGYDRWENFVKVIEKAKTAAQNSGLSVADHFPDVTKMVGIGSDAKRQIDDIALTRHACYLIAQNGDPRKEAVAFAMAYFAIQTRKQELIEKRIAEIERLAIREKLTNSEKELSGIVFERGVDGAGFARIKSRADKALFGGHTTGEMKRNCAFPPHARLRIFCPQLRSKRKISLMN